MLKYVLRAVYCLFLGKVMKAIAVHFVHDEWNAGQRSYPWAVPAEHDSSSGARASVLTVETELQSGRFTRELRLFNLYF